MYYAFYDYIEDRWIGGPQLIESDVKSVDVIVKNNEVYLGYNKGYYSGYIKKIGESPELVIDNNVVTWFRIYANDEKLCCFFCVNYENTLYVTERDLTGGSWSDPTILSSNKLIDMYRFDVASTLDGKVHICYPAAIDKQIVHQYYDGNSWSTPFIVDSSDVNSPQSQMAADPNFNDIYVMWNVPYGGPSNTFRTYLRQYDAAPLTPTNLTITANWPGHPSLAWQHNQEADFQHYEVWRKRKFENWELLATTTNKNHIDLTAEVMPWEDDEATYKVRAKDMSGYVSDFSNEVSAWVLYKGNNAEVHEYELTQNYPNPFNPTTTISYKVKEAGLVTLKVYDILGKEVAVLINEVKEPGAYKVEFNASSLPSGVYIYAIKVNDFMQNYKMSLVK